MKIISPYHDYYDSILKSTGIDTSIVYIRKPSTESIPVNEFLNFSRFYLQDRTIKGGLNLYVRIFPVVISFCNVIHKGIKVVYRKKISKAVFGDKHHITYLWNEDAYSLLQKIIDNEIEFAYSKTTLSNNLYEFKNASPNLLDIHHKFKCPIIGFPQSGFTNSIDYKVDFTKILLNPKLIDLNFQSVIDPYTALQELMMFIPGVLGGTERSTVDVSNLDKISAHGYDTKWSFRRKVHQNKRKRKHVL